MDIRRANHSVVMNSSTFLPGGGELDSQVQITTTEDNTAFITIYVVNGPNLHIRVEPDEWDRYRLSL
jgi:hypothetical protein